MALMRAGAGWESRGATTSRWTPLCCLALIVAAASGVTAQDASTHGHGAKAALISAAVKDPLAVQDSYAQLSDRNKEYWVRVRIAIFSRAEKTQSAHNDGSRRARSNAPPYATDNPSLNSSIVVILSRVSALSRLAC